MDHAKKLLNQLLDKVENRTTDRQRVFIRFYKAEYAPYENGDAEEKQKIHLAVEQLASDGFIQYKWIRHEEGNLLERIWLTPSCLEEAYAYVGRRPREEIDTAVEGQIAQCAATLHKSWLCTALEQDSGLRKEENLSEFLRMICALDCIGENQTIAQRVFSAQCFGDSKRFERKYRSKLLRILKNGFRETEMNDAQLLAYAGIVKNPTPIEFCGAISLILENGTMDFSMMKDGAAILTVDVGNVRDVDMSRIKRIVSIENRTSYYEYICNDKKFDDLVIYSAGFLSPEHKRLYGMLAKSGKPFVHWGDIDLGGIEIFLQIRDIVPNLQPLRMDCATLARHVQETIPCTAEYLEKCRLAMNRPKYHMFKDVLNWVVSNKRKLEQENI